MDPSRVSYHHGGLRAALIAEGLRVARTGGAAALGMRELTRAVGVSPNAAYRHFADRQALVLAVALEAQDLLADAMRARIAPSASPLDRLRAVGLGYIHFARTERGWFELAILTRDDGPPGTNGPFPAPFQLLLDALDGLVASGGLPAARRAHAEWACWSTVHGFADLTTRGPLRRQDPATLDALASYVVDTVIEGLTSGGST
ncbi:TetR/AcrR family transcriptional regulator [Asanoa hainanensis]|uniref:TetR/AcrR family transcriptional regulator n=1 Tax=Asanoa hainanensis TaxID=560556 RepID=UPI001C530486|nr:TetR/AcrR family transcriptional regulator [Asanoa hainanensis]